MQPLSAIDAVAPAFTRTHQTLFQPFRMGRSWKLSASSYLGWMGSMFIPLPIFVFFLPHNAFPGSDTLRATLFVFYSVFTLVALVILYFCARMELVVFEMVVTRSKFIAPMWRRYSARIWPWLGFKVLVGTLYTIVIAGIFYVPMRHMIEAMIASLSAFSSIPHDGKPDPEAIQQIIAPVMAEWINLEMIGVTLAFVLKIPSTLLNDFVLPFYVLEDIPLFAAIGRGFQVFRADPVQVILYLILKPILFGIGYIMQSIALGICMIPLILAVILVVVVAGLVLPHGAHTGVAWVLALVVGYLGFAALMLYVTTFAVGYLLTLLEAYGIYFLGGRYPLLGNMLEPGPGGPFTPPPVFPSDEELRNNDGGPPMPMDPVVA